MRFRTIPKVVNALKLRFLLRILAKRRLGAVGIQLLDELGIPATVPVEVTSTPQGEVIRFGRVSFGERPASGMDGHYDVFALDDGSIIVGFGDDAYELEEREVDELILRGLTIYRSRAVSMDDEAAA